VKKVAISETKKKFEVGKREIVAHNMLFGPVVHCISLDITFVKNV
jgi:hypothetical protein